MKTTIDLPDKILHEAKIVAAQRKTTLKHLVEAGLGYVLAHPDSAPGKDRKMVLQELLKKMRASNSKAMVPLKRSEIYDR